MEVVKRGKSNVTCCVSGCRSRVGKDPHLHFHVFPPIGERKVKIISNAGVTLTLDRFKAWEYVLRCGRKISKYMRVCSRHFKNTDYFLPGLPAKRKHLRKDAVPSLNLPLVPFSRPKPKQRKERNNDTVVKNPLSAHQEHQETKSVQEAAHTLLQLGAKQKENEAQKVIETQKGHETHKVNETSKVIKTKNAIESQKVIETSKVFQTENAIEAPKVVEIIKIIEIPKIIEKVIEIPKVIETQTEDKGVQVNSGDMRTTFADLLDTDAKLNTATGIPTIKILETLVTLLKKEFPEKRNSNNLQPKEKIVLTMFKVKQDVSYVMLAIHFNISSQSCKNIFLCTIIRLSTIFKKCIMWPAKEEILKNIPVDYEEASLFIERSNNSRIKVFKLLNNKLAGNMTSHFEDIITVVYSIVSMSVPIMNEPSYVINK